MSPSPKEPAAPRLTEEGEGAGIARFLEALRLRLADWPLPLAYRAEQILRSQAEPAPLVDLSFHLYGQCLRLTSLYLVGAYVGGEMARTDLNTAIAEGLRRPLLGQWRGFLREALDRLPPAALEVPLVRAVSSFHATVGVKRDSPGPAVIRDGRVVQGQASVLDALLQIRNDLVHGARGLDSEVARLVLDSMAPLMTRLVEALDSLQGFRLLAWSPSGGRIPLHGPAPPEKIEDHTCVIVDPNGVQQSLYPFALIDLLGENLRKPDAPPVDLLLYDGRQEKRLRFLGLQEAQERKDAYAAFTTALERKALAARLSDPMARWDRSRLREALVLRQFQFEADGRAAAPPEIAVPRPQVEERLQEFLAGPAPAVLLTGPPGSGRSAVLAQLVRKLLAAGTPALNLSASLLAPQLPYASFPEILSETFALQATLPELVAAGGRPAGDPKLVLAIDALESVGPVETMRQFIDGIEGLARAYPAGDLKVLLAIQSQALARALEATPPLDERTWFRSVVSGPDGELVTVPELPVEELSAAESEALYDALCQRPGATGPLTPWRLLPEPIRERLRSPAFARRLVMAMSGQTIRHADVVMAVERAYLRQELCGSTYDPRRRAWRDAFPGRKRVVEEVARSVLEQRRQEVPVPSFAELQDDYAEVLARGVLREVLLETGAEGLAIRFASPGTFAAAAAELLAQDGALQNRVLLFDDLSALCSTVVGLEAALAEVVERNLEHSGAVIGRLNLEEHGHIHREIVAGALLRLAEATSQGPVSRALQQVLDRKEKAVVEDVIFLALAEGHSSARPRGAAVLAEAALEQSLGTRSGSLLRIARALRRAGKAELAERALRVVPGDCTAASEAKRGYLLGSLLRDHGRWEEGLALLRLAKAEFRALGDPDGLLAARASIAETLSLLERFDEAAADLDEAEREMAGAGTETELLFRIKHAQSLRMRGLLRKAYVRCQDVLRRATSAALAPLAARAQTEMGIIHALLDDPAGGIRFLESAIATKRQLGDSRGLKQAYLCLGFAQAKGQNMPAACAAYEQSLALNQETNDYYGELLCLEFLTRLDPSLAKEAQIAQAVARAHTVESWKNPRIKTIVERFKRELNPSGGT